MDLKRTWSEWSKVQRGIAIGVAALLVALIAIFAFVKLHRSRNLANTMRLIRKEGFVFLEENNELKTVTNNMRFQSGDVLTTGKQSLASISLDDTKIITMEEQSTVDFSKSGKQLELKLRSGKIYFEVNKPLEQDESMYIQTSNMIVGIRGTAGYVFYDREGHQCVLLTSGEVTISATNPWTGETKTTTVKAGQLLITYLYSDRTTDSVMFELMEADSIPADMDPSGIETIPSDVSETTLETQESTSATTKATSTTKNASETSEPDEGGNRPSGTPKHPPTMTPAPGSGGAKNTPTPAPGNKSGSGSGSGSGSKSTPTPSARPTPEPSSNGGSDDTKETEGTTENTGSTEPKESSSSDNGGTSSSSSESSKQSSSESSKQEATQPNEGGNGEGNGGGDNGGGSSDNKGGENGGDNGGGNSDDNGGDNGGGNNGETEGNGDGPIIEDDNPDEPIYIGGDGQQIIG